MTAGCAVGRGLRMKILVTGVSGFLGSQFARFALANGASVVGCDMDDAFGRLVQSGLAREGDFEFVKLDLCDAEPQLPGDISHIVHLAALAHVDYSVAFPEKVLTNNLNSTLTILRIARTRKVPVVFSSSVEVYGGLEIKVFSEDDTRFGLSAYALSKIRCEDLCLHFKRHFDVPTTILRLTNLFGPWQSPDRVIPRVIMRGLEYLEMWADLYRTRDFVYVDDAVRAIWLVTQCQTISGTYNISSGTPRRISDVVMQVGCALGVPHLVAVQNGQRQDGRGTHLSSCSDRAKVDLGWHVEHGFADALAATVAWYADHRAWTNQFLDSIATNDPSTYVVDKLRYQGRCPSDSV